ncbi:c-type cytochrome [Acetobacteraceae bacterium H6797]|nr:c-type cytochrome [Acetobacteraceae bacterium H6797]
MRRLMTALAFLAIAAPVAARAQDAAAGERVFRQQCGACHRFDRNGVGPELGDLFGRPAGSVEGFRYSSAMKGSGLVWEQETLADFLRGPRAKVPGTSMPYVGLRDESRLGDLLAYLRASGKPRP